MSNPFFPVASSRPARHVGGAARRAPWLALILVATFLGGFLVAPVPTSPVDTASAQGDEDLMHISGWSLGDWWAWDKVPTENSKDRSGGEIYERVIGQELIEMEAYDEEKHESWMKRHQTWKTRLYANQTANTGYGPGTITSKQDRNYRVDDHGLARIRAETHYGFETAPELNSGSLSQSEYFPPKLDLAFPHRDGDHFQVRSHPLTMDKSGNCGGPNQTGCNSTTKKFYRYDVIRQEKLTLELGRGLEEKRMHTFDTWVIVQRDLFRIDDVKRFDEHRYQIWWYAPEACNVVQKYEHKADGTHIKSWYLRDFHCAGKDLKDPTYATYDFQNYSSTRKHGELSVHDDYERFLQTLRENAAGGGSSGAGASGGVWGEFGSLPAPGFLTMVPILIALALAVQRRQGRGPDHEA